MKFINIVLLYVTNFIGSWDENEYGLISYSNDSEMSFLDNIVG